MLPDGWWIPFWEAFPISWTPCSVWATPRWVCFISSVIMWNKVYLVVQNLHHCVRVSLALCNCLGYKTNLCSTVYWKLFMSKYLIFNAIEHPGNGMKPIHIPAIFCYVWQGDDLVLILTISTTAVSGGIINQLDGNVLSGINTYTIINSREYTAEPFSTRLIRRPPPRPPTVG